MSAALRASGALCCTSAQVTSWRTRAPWLRPGPAPSASSSSSPSCGSPPTPHDLAYPARAWATLLGLPDPAGRGARRINEAILWLEQR
jgi:hypothetical protein